MGSTNKRDTAGVRLSLVAQQHTPEAFHTLLDVMKNGKSDGARVNAACAILDRGSGRPATQAEFVEPDEPVVYRTVEEVQREILDTLRRLPKRLIVPLLKEIIGSNSPEDRDDKLHVDGGVDDGGGVDGGGGVDSSGGVDGGGSGGVDGGG